MADANAVKEITSKLENGVKELFESDKYAAYLQTMSRFHKYSTRNTVLIHMQKPDATHVAGFQAWRNKFNRQVMKGEHGIKIFAPIPVTIKEEKEKLDPVTKQPIIGEDGLPVMEEYIKAHLARFRVVSVFDVSQTTGEPLPELAENLTGSVERYELFMDALRSVSPLPISFEDLPAADGLCIFGDRIAIRNGMSEVQTVSAVIHEITHAKLHDIEALRLADENAQLKGRRTEEVEAESVAFAVNQYYGIDTGANSFGYIAEWSKGRELKELNASLDTIRKTAAELIDGIDEKYRELAKERGIDLSVSTPAKDEASPAPVADTGRSETGKIYAYYCNIVANRAHEYMTSSGILMDYQDDDKAKEACDLCVKRVVDDLLLEPGGEKHMRLFDQYMDNAEFKARLEDYAFIKAYLEPKKAEIKAAQEGNTEKQEAVISDTPAILGDYERDAKVRENPRAADIFMLQPVFVNGNFNREGKKIRVAAEEPIGKYRIYSRDESEQKTYYFMTASGMIDRTSQYFRDEWNEEASKWENHLPTEAELDEVITQAAEQFERDLADPTEWARYNHAAILNRIPECEDHNVPVRELREQERKAEAAAAERERQEEERIFNEKYDARIDEIAEAISTGKPIRVSYSNFDYGGKNPVLDLFKLYGIELPIRTQGWVNTGLAEITSGGYRYYSGKNKRSSTVFHDYLEKLREAIKETPITQKRQQGQPVASTEVRDKVGNELYEKFAEMFPDFASGKYSYMRLESEGFEPLSLEWVFGDRISVMHYYVQNGDLCCDPMMEFRFDNTGKTMASSMFQQDIPPLYQYFDEDGIGHSVDGNGNTREHRNLQSELDGFASQWLDNIAEQGFMPVEAHLVLADNEEIAVTFDGEGNPIMPKQKAPEKEVAVGDVLLMQGKKWRVENINGDFSISLKNLDPADIQSSQMLMGHWKERLEEEGYSIVTENEKEYSLGYGFLGNGITVWNHADEKDGDYATVAHIGTDRTVTFYDKDMPHDIKEQIDKVAKSGDTAAFGFTTAPENKLPGSGADMPPFTAHEAAKKVLDKPVELDMSLPDPTISADEMKQYGYTHDEMLPLSNGRAVELLDTGHTVFLLHPDGTESMAFDSDEIRKHDGLCGIEKLDWNRSSVKVAQLAIALEAERKRDAEFINGTGNRFAIYQIPSGADEQKDYRFMSLLDMDAKGIEVDRANYKLVYTAPFDERIEFLSDRYPVLNRIYEDFNMNHPDDYKGRSVSVSDVIVLGWDGNVSAHFVDSIGFVELDGFYGTAAQPAIAAADTSRNDTDVAAKMPPAENLSASMAKHAPPPMPKGKPSLLTQLNETKQHVEQSRKAAVAENKRERGHE